MLPLATPVAPTNLRQHGWSRAKRRTAVLVVVLLILGFFVIRFAQASSADTGTVVRIVDGDTLVVKYRGGERRVRLLNVDTPETKDPNAPVECLGPEATAEIKRLLPEGTVGLTPFDGHRLRRLLPPC